MIKQMKPLWNGEKKRGTSKNEKEWINTIYNCWKIEQELHEKFKDDRHYPAEKFGGHTECFKIDSKILSHFPKNNS